MAPDQTPIIPKGSKAICDFCGGEYVVDADGIAEHECRIYDKTYRFRNEPRGKHIIFGEDPGCYRIVPKNLITEKPAQKTTEKTPKTPKPTGKVVTVPIPAKPAKSKGSGKKKPNP